MNMHLENRWFYFGIDGKKAYRGSSGKSETHREQYLNSFMAFMVRVGMVVLILIIAFIIVLIAGILFWYTPIGYILLALHLMLRALWRKGLKVNDWTLGFQTAFQHR
ncbi:MAG: hypothetical protein WA030_02095 [Candidatus Microsaccharimonas sp.]